jgi:hypothetical protein
MVYSGPKFRKRPKIWDNHGVVRKIQEKKLKYKNLR